MVNWSRSIQTDTKTHMEKHLIYSPLPTVSAPRNKINCRHFSSLNGPNPTVLHLRSTPGWQIREHNVPVPLGHIPQPSALQKLLSQEWLPAAAALHTQLSRTWVSTTSIPLALQRAEGQGSCSLCSPVFLQRERLTYGGTEGNTSLTLKPHFHMENTIKDIEGLNTSFPGL